MGVPISHQHLQRHPAAFLTVLVGHLASLGCNKSTTADAVNEIQTEKEENTNLVICNNNLYLCQRLHALSIIAFHFSASIQRNATPLSFRSFFLYPTSS